MLKNKSYKKFSQRPFQVSKQNIINSGFRTSPSSQREMVCINGAALENQVDSLFNGSEIGSSSYVKNSQFRFLKTGNIQNDFLIDFNSVEYCKQTKNIVLQGNEILIAEDGGGDGLGESCLYIKNPNYTDYLCNGILALRIENEDKRNFIFGFLKSNYFKEFIDNNTPMASTLRHSNGISKKFIIPIYDQNNENHKLLHMLVKNLIDKEHTILLKNKIIDETIKSELNISKTSFIQASKSLFIKNDFRCSGGLYNQNFLNIYQSIQNYKNGYFNILDKYNSKRGQNLQVSNIGDSYYSTKYKKGFYKLVTTMELSDKRTIHSYRYLGNKNNLSVVRTNSIMLSADGTVGKSIFVGEEHFISNIHQWILVSKNNISKHKIVFVSLFLQFLRNNGYYEYIKDKANGGAIKEPHLNNFLHIPKFSDFLQKEISLNYYNNVINNNNNLNNYISNELSRNKELGIWQLNMECFELKAKINKLVEKIILNKKVHQPFYLK